MVRNNSSVRSRFKRVLYFFIFDNYSIKTLQPAGQSVALQSMQRDTSINFHTDGFWDKENFENNKHIIFIQSENENDWKDK